MIGRIERVPLREVWAHEAHGFTRWLEDHPEQLSDALGFEGPDEAENANRFAVLEGQRSNIEAVFGEPLDWSRVEGRKKCSIGHDLQGGGYRDPAERWPGIRARTIEAMIRLHEALKPHVARLL